MLIVLNIEFYESPKALIVHARCCLTFQLTPIERYAVQFTEQMMEPINEEELKVAEVKIIFTHEVRTQVLEFQ